MATKIGGRAKVFINGTQYPVKGDVKVMSSDNTRTSIVGVDGYHGISETPVASWCEFTLSDFPGIDISSVQNLTDATVNIQFDNGKQAVFRNAAQINAIELDQSDGSYGCRFEGPSCVWIGS